MLPLFLKLLGSGRLGWTIRTV